MTSGEGAGLQIRQVGEDVLVTVRVRPRARPGIEAVPDLIVVSVAAPPVEGKATEEARRALAQAAGVPAFRVTLATGARSRTKVFRIAGANLAEVATALRSPRSEAPRSRRGR